ncbi:hypothetical protein Val02_69370 [Virgisporangium aliadipatigenens]|uniref:HTH cro/C1-type domain-containing protein n=1 Tax=Virgisporangium aliadipatigenens TaxID=741659 RepID=A0A8J4DU79_9ACTN|nr:helix-turn-helix transcriptional regulator [Virgisporangium aliadipatigenens]GIJ50051.1 hypothetical protein Val02_69370 [Virgisporangium aliadipatigenens]
MITGHSLRLAREQRGVGLDRLAALIGRTKGHLSQVERGVNGRGVTPALVRAYEEALGVQVEATPIGGSFPETMKSVSNNLGRERTIPRQHGNAATSVEDAAARAMDFAVWAEATNVGVTTLERLETETRRLAKDYLTRPPIEVFAHTSKLTRTAFDLIQGGHQHLNQTRDLYVAGGWLSALLSWISGDLGQPAAAAEHARAALICADQVGHATLRAWALSVASKAAYWDGDYTTAADHAREGQKSGANGTALVFLACQEADALKETRRTSEAVDALNRARSFRDKVDSTDDVGGLFSCGHARQANYEIGVRLAAKEPTEALKAAKHAEEAYKSGEQWAYGTWAQIQFGVALARIQRDNIDGANEVLEGVFEMSPEHRLDTLVQRSGEVARALREPRREASRDARALVDRIREFQDSRVTIRELPQ